MRRYKLNARLDCGSPLEAKTGKTPDPDRKSKAIRQRERMRVADGATYTDYTGLLSPETLKRYIAHKEK